MKYAIGFVTTVVVGLLSFAAVAATPKKDEVLSNTSQNANDAEELRKRAVEVGPEDTTWTEIWREEFRGSSFDPKVWGFISAPTGTYPDTHRKMYCYTHITDDPVAYKFTGETVNLLAIKNPDLKKDPRPYLCGGIRTQDRMAFKYGKLEVRFRLTGFKGGWPAIWLLPEVPQPLYGEIDMLERLNFDAFAYQTVHTHYSLRLQETYPPRYTTTPINTNGWNTVGVEWYPEKLVYTMNGKRVYCWPKIKTDKPGQWTFDAPYHLIIDNQLGGDWVGPIGPETLPGEMEIDNVVYYKGTRNGKTFGELYRYPTAKARTRAQTFTRDGETLRYRYHAPKNIEPGKKYPLVVFFHGAGERGTDNWAQLVHGASEILDFAERAGEEIFFVAGQVPAGCMWVDHPWNSTRHTMNEKPTPQLRLVLDLIDKLMKEQPIDAARVYATGISMGGYGTWEAVQRRPERFAAAMPICGGGDTVQAAKVKDVPIWCFHGDKDDAVPVSRSRDMFNAIKAAGGNQVQYREYPGCGHNCWDATYRDDAVLKWLFSQRKVAGAACASGAATAGAVELKDGAEFAMRDVPKELIAHVKRGGSVRLILEENGTTGYQWETTYASNECSVVIEHLGADTSTGLCGTPGKAAFTVTKKAAVQAPAVVEFAYRRSWEKGEPAQRVRLVLHTVPGETAGEEHPVDMSQSSDCWK